MPEFSSEDETCCSQKKENNLSTSSCKSQNKNEGKQKPDKYLDFAKEAKM